MQWTGHCDASLVWVLDQQNTTRALCLLQFLLEVECACSPYYGGGVGRHGVRPSLAEVPWTVLGSNKKASHSLRADCPRHAEAVMEPVSLLFALSQHEVESFVVGCPGEKGEWLWLNASYSERPLIWTPRYRCALWILVIWIPLVTGHFGVQRSLHIHIIMQKLVKELFSSLCFVTSSGMA